MRVNSYLQAKRVLISISNALFSENLLAMVEKHLIVIAVRQRNKSDKKNDQNRTLLQIFTNCTLCKATEEPLLAKARVNRKKKWFVHFSRVSAHGIHPAYAFTNSEWRNENRTLYRVCSFMSCWDTAVFTVSIFFFLLGFTKFEWLPKLMPDKVWNFVEPCTPPAKQFTICSEKASNKCSTGTERRKFWQFFLEKSIRLLDFEQRNNKPLIWILCLESNRCLSADQQFKHFSEVCNLICRRPSWSWRPWSTIWVDLLIR